MDTKHSKTNYVDPNHKAQEAKKEPPKAANPAEPYVPAPNSVSRVYSSALTEHNVVMAAADIALAKARKAPNERAAVAAFWQSMKDSTYARMVEQ